MNNILEINGLNKSYGDFSLSGISFALPQGAVMGLVGPKGAGKTKIIKAVLNMTPFDEGEISIFSVSTYYPYPAKMTDYIGLVMSEAFYHGEWQIGDVEAIISPFYSSWDKNTFENCLRRFKLPWDKKIKEFSEDMKARLMLAAAVSHKARLLILDEPDLGLDPEEREEFMSVLREFMADKSRGILYAVREASEVEAIADYITTIANGKVEYTGEKSRLSRLNLRGEEAKAHE